MPKIDATTGVWTLACTGFISLTVMGFMNNKPELIVPSATSALSAAIALTRPQGKDG